MWLLRRRIDKGCGARLCAGVADLSSGSLRVNTSLARLSALLASRNSLRRRDKRTEYRAMDDLRPLSSGATYHYAALLLFDRLADSTVAPLGGRALSDFLPACFFFFFFFFFNFMRRHSRRRRKFGSTSTQQLAQQRVRRIAIFLPASSGSTAKLSRAYFAFLLPRADLCMQLRAAASAAAAALGSSLSGVLGFPCLFLLSLCLSL